MIKKSASSSAMYSYSYVRYQRMSRTQYTKVLSTVLQGFRMNLPRRLIKTIARTRATADCAIRAGGSALKACERLAQEASALSPAEKGLLDISFTYRYHRSCEKQERQHVVLNAVRPAVQRFECRRMDG